jgi:tetratricopeptide (TPR) repeat protein
MGGIRGGFGAVPQGVAFAMKSFLSLFSMETASSRERSGQARKRVASWILCLLHGAAVFAHGPFHEQILDLTQRIASAPEEWALVAQRCDLQRAHGLWPEAEADLVVLERLRPADPTNQLRRGYILLGKGEGAEAVPPLKRWIDAHPTNVEERLILAQALRHSGKWAEAAREYSMVLEGTDVPRAQTYLERAECLVQAGASPTNIVTGLDAGIGRCGALPPLVRMAAELELQSGKVEEAAARVRKLGEGSARKERWLFEEAEIYRRGGKPAQAEDRYRASLAAVEALPPRFQRALTAKELRSEIEQRLNPSPLR